jgi:hypothetical protein
MLKGEGGGNGGGAHDRWLSRLSLRVGSPLEEAAVEEPETVEARAENGEGGAPGGDGNGWIGGFASRSRSELSELVGK